MLEEFAGFTLSRTIPDNVLSGVLSGAYKIYGGVVRDGSGQIVAHLVNSGNLSSISNVASSFASPINSLFTGMNTFQLHRIGQDVDKLVSMSQATMAISGLTLAVSAAGFMFLNHKLNKIDEKLIELSADVKFIRNFLELQERAKLMTAFKNVRAIESNKDISIKNELLLDSRKNFGECHELYKSLLSKNTNIKDLIPVEEYFTLTAIGYSLCSAELGLHDQAAKDLKESFDVWQSFSKTFVKDSIFGDNPERFLTKKYAPHIKSEEIASWMDFAWDTDIGLDVLDVLRDKTPRFDINFSTTLDKEEALSIEVARKLVQRERVLQGYISQYEYYAEHQIAPSSVNKFISSLPKENEVSNTFIFINNELINQQHNGLMVNS